MKHDRGTKPGHAIRTALYRTTAYDRCYFILIVRILTVIMQHDQTRCVATTADTIQGPHDNAMDFF